MTASETLRRVPGPAGALVITLFSFGKMPVEHGSGEAAPRTAATSGPIAFRHGNSGILAATG
jgi:hypothetical protein